eukprot:CAMPEP_0115675448 /NCGR_PEP_ID=MMETSP0272-20121206/54155_1 /TAXON_ID=71861 /ORGANISM="Scrippsiella trochoidea, Strain CCMP3099" /LENGTH=171 /DNA_ID=CAMNT_0003114415 /DNA_START=944 /DNA_END=1458 /DNA_ORIENTATION=-
MSASLSKISPLAAQQSVLGGHHAGIWVVANEAHNGACEGEEQVMRESSPVDQHDHGNRHEGVFQHHENAPLAEAKHHQNETIHDASALLTRANRNATSLHLCMVRNSAARLPEKKPTHVHLNKVTGTPSVHGNPIAQQTDEVTSPKRMTYLSAAERDPVPTIQLGAVLLHK